MTYPINSTLTRGATDVREILAQHLETYVPLLIEDYRDAYSMDEHSLPEPVDYRQYEPTGLDRWPLVGCSISRSRNWARVDQDRIGANMYRSKYEVQLFLWVRTPQTAEDRSFEPEYDECLRLRDDLTAIVRHALLADGSLGSPRVELNEDTLTEAYSEATKVKGDRWIAGTTWNFDLTFDESNVTVSAGQVDRIDVVAVRTDVIPQ